MCGLQQEGDSSHVLVLIQAISHQLTHLLCQALTALGLQVNAEELQQVPGYNYSRIAAAAVTLFHGQVSEALQQVAGAVGELGPSFDLGEEQCWMAQLMVVGHLMQKMLAYHFNQAWREEGELEQQQEQQSEVHGSSGGEGNHQLRGLHATSTPSGAAAAAAAAGGGGRGRGVGGFQLTSGGKVASLRRVATRQSSRLQHCGRPSAYDECTQQLQQQQEGGEGVPCTNFPQIVAGLQDQDRNAQERSELQTQHEEAPEHMPASAEASHRQLYMSKLADMVLGALRDLGVDLGAGRLPEEGSTYATAGACVVQTQNGQPLIAEPSASAIKSALGAGILPAALAVAAVPMGLLEAPEALASGGEAAAATPASVQVTAASPGEVEYGAGATEPAVAAEIEADGCHPSLCEQPELQPCVVGGDTEAGPSSCEGQAVQGLMLTSVPFLEADAANEATVSAAAAADVHGAVVGSPHPPQAAALATNGSNIAGPAVGAAAAALLTANPEVKACLEAASASLLLGQVPQALEEAGAAVQLLLHVLHPASHLQQLGALLVQWHLQHQMLLAHFQLAHSQGAQEQYPEDEQELLQQQHQDRGDHGGKVEVVEGAEAGVRHEGTQEMCCMDKVDEEQQLGDGTEVEESMVVDDAQEEVQEQVLMEISEEEEEGHLEEKEVRQIPNIALREGLEVEDASPSKLQQQDEAMLESSNKN
jgi:hypothetical protein